MGFAEPGRREIEAGTDLVPEAARSLFEERGHKSTTMEEAAKKAVTSNGTVYLYFKKKEALLFFLLTGSLEELRDNLLPILETDAEADLTVIPIGRAIRDFHRSRSGLSELTLLKVNSCWKKSPEELAEAHQAALIGALDIIKRVLEKMGSTTGREPRDPLESAVFFLAPDAGLFVFVSISQPDLRWMADKRKPLRKTREVVLREPLELDEDSVERWQRKDESL